MSTGPLGERRKAGFQHLGALAPTDQSYRSVHANCCSWVFSCLLAIPFHLLQFHFLHHASFLLFCFQSLSTSSESDKRFLTHTLHTSRTIDL